MLNLVFAQWRKTKGTLIRPMIIVLPLLFSFLLSFYFGTTKSSESFPGERWINFYLLLMIAILFFSGMLISLFVQLDKNAGNFGNELRIGVSRNKIMASKIVFFMGLMIAVELLAAIIFIFLGFLLQMPMISFPVVAVYFLINSLLILPIILIYTFCAYRLNFTGTLIVSTVFGLSAILMGTTSLGHNLWKFLPWIWPVKLSAELLPSILYLTGTIQTIAMENIKQIIIGAVVSSTLLFLLMSVWYNQWEGKASLEE